MAPASGHVALAGVRVVEVDRSDRQDRRRQGKSDPLDAVSAARAAQSGLLAVRPRAGTARWRRSGRHGLRAQRRRRTHPGDQPGQGLSTGPIYLRARFTRHTPAALVAGIASLRPRPGDVPGYATRVALRELGRRAVFLDGQLERLEELIVLSVTARAPGLLALYGIGATPRRCCLSPPGTTPACSAPRPPGAHLCAAAPIPASSGKSPATG